MAVVNLGFIGSRGHYGVVLDELKTMPSLRVAAICDGGDTAAPIAAWCREHGHAPRTFADHRAMLDRAGLVDAVVVCGPFERHAEMCIDAIERGVHVLTEKPAALTLDDLARLRDACARHPNVHLAGMMFSRYDPGFYTAKRLIDAGAIGDVRLIDARKSYKLGTRAAYYHDRSTYGGTIPWVGSHAIDWVMWMSGQPCERVYATHSAEHNAGTGTMERSALCHFTMPGGRFASVSIDVFRPSSAPTHGDDWLRVVGTEGVLEARSDSLTLIDAENDGSRAVPVSCDRQPLADFVNHISGAAPALIDASSTLALTDACLRARESADQRRVVEF